VVTVTRANAVAGKLLFVALILAAGVEALSGVFLLALLLMAAAWAVAAAVDR
jgi:hypothetical protein